MSSSEHVHCASDGVGPVLAARRRSGADRQSGGARPAGPSPLQEKKEARRELRREPVEPADWRRCSKPTAVCWSSAHSAGTSRVGLAGTEAAPAAGRASRPARLSPASGATSGQPGSWRTTGDEQSVPENPETQLHTAPRLPTAGHHTGPKLRPG